MLLRNSLFSLIAFATIVVSLAVSCKQTTEEPNYCATSPGGCNSVMIAKEFFLFKPGSWWVYEEEYSGVRDSMYVLSSANGSTYDFDIVIKSALDNFQYHYWPQYTGQPTADGCSETAPVAKKCMSIKCSKGIPGGPGVSLGESRCMFFQYNLKDSVGSNNIDYPNNFIHITSIMNTYQLGNFLFDKTTIKVFEPHNGHNGNHPTYRYFSKGVGLVRLELADTTETWNLVNYHIQP